MPLALRQIIGFIVIACFALISAMASTENAAEKKDSGKKVAFYTKIAKSDNKTKKVSRRYPRPGFHGKTLPTQLYKGMTLLAPVSQTRAPHPTGLLRERSKKPLTLLKRARRKFST